MRLERQVPRALMPLRAPSRYKGAYGGRGGAKSHFFAEELIERCFTKETRAVCLREVQNTLKESVRQLLCDKISKFGLGEFFEPLEAEIRARNGSIIIFRGMQAFNAESIKSLEGFDIAWIEEAQTFSARSLRMLRPTIRKPGSEIWASWNPRHDDDAIDDFFRGATKYPGAICVPVGWADNPWFPEVLQQEMEHDYAADAEMAEHVWGGGYEIITEASYFARLIAKAENEGRIGDFPHDPKKRLRTGWDIGVDDYTAIWFIEDNGEIPTVVDFYEASGEGVPQLVAQCLPELLPELDQQVSGLRQLGRDEPFKYNVHFLPHDVKVREWGGGAKERIVTLHEHGVKPVHAGVKDKDGDRINATRELLKILRFNNTPRVQKGIKRIRRYSRRFNEAMQTFGEPLKDGNDHAADALGEYALNCGLIPEPEPKKKPEPEMRGIYDMTMDEAWKLLGKERQRERV